MAKKPTNHDELMANMGLTRTRKQKRIFNKLYSKSQEITHDQDTKISIPEEAEHKLKGIENNDVSGVHDNN